MMKVKKKLIWFVLLVIVLAGFGYGVKEYYRKPADLSLVIPAAQTDAASLVACYTNDEKKSDSIYLGKPIDVTGTVSEINSRQDTVINIMLGKRDDLHRVSCLLNGKYLKAANELQPGSKITIRGICTGFLMDVELNRCVLIN